MNGSTSPRRLDSKESPAEGLSNDVQRPPDTGQLEGQPSPLRRYFLLVLFCLAQFMDAYNGSALFTAIPTLVAELGFTAGESPWIISAYQLTFASFLLIVSFLRCHMSLPHCSSSSWLDRVVK